MLLPYASDRPPRNPPATVVTLVLLNFAVFGLVALALYLRREETAVIWYANLSLVPASLQWYTLLTHAFLHENVFHLSANMLFLWVFGGSVEDAIGWKRFLAFYLGAAVVTGLLQALLTRLYPGADPTTPIVGASGAVSAAVGVFAVRFYRSRIRFIGLPLKIPAILLLAAVLIGEMAVVLWRLTYPAPAASGQAVAHWAHIGGFVLGMIWAQGTRLMRAGRVDYLAEDAAQEMERGSPLSAARRWEAVLRADPGNLHAEAELGRAWALAGDREQSLAHYRRAISGLLRQGDRPEAAARYRQMTEFFADAALDAPEQFAVANALEETGYYATALAALQALLQDHAEAREAEMALLRIGVLHLKRLNEPDAAVENLERFLGRYPVSEWRAYAEELLRAARRVQAGGEENT